MPGSNFILNHKIYLSVLFICLCSCHIFSQKYIFKHYNLSEGLPHPYIYTINQGEQGFLWIGTAEGLCRYDGKEFINYTTANGLAENFVTTSLIDSKNRKWFGHYQGGITLFEHEKFKIINRNEWATSRINSFRESRYHHKIWVCTQSNGLLSIDPHHIVTSVSGISKELIVWDVEEINSNQLAVATNEGLKIVSLSSKNPAKEIEELSYFQVINIIGIAKNNLVVATDYDGIFSIQFSKKGYVVKKLIESTHPSINDKILFISKSPTNELWISRNESGLSRNIIQKDSIVQLEKYNKQTGLNFNHIKSAYMDREKNVWLGTYGDGLYQLTKQVFTIYKPAQTGSEIIQNFCFTSPDYALISTAAKGLKLYKASDNFSPIPIPAIDNNADLQRSSCHYIFKDSQGALYIALAEKGVYKSQPGKLKFDQWFFIKGDKLSNNINQIVEDSSGNIWMATNNGAYKTPPAGKDIVQYNMLNGLAHNSIYGIFVDTKKTVWFATHGSGITTYHDSTFTTLPSPLAIGLDVNCFAEDRFGNIWIGTHGQGVFRYKDGKFRRQYLVKDGFGSNFCYTLAIDAKDQVWVGHKNGLSKLEIKNDHITFTSNAKDLQGAEITANAIVYGENNNIWYGTNKGLLKYDPAKDQANRTEAVTNIIGLKIFSLEPDWNKLKVHKTLISPPSDIILPYNLNHLTFNYIGICLIEPEKVKYKYFLEGWDNAWSMETYETATTYSNLPPGNYKFQVMSTNNDGLWNKKPATYSFEITPPFWQTLWFYSLIILLIFFGVYLVFKIRTQRLQQQKRNLEKEKIKLESEIRERKAAEKKLTESELALQTANNELNNLIWRSYHDLRGPSTTIQGLVNIALMEDETDKVPDYLRMIMDTTTRMDSILKDFFKVSDIRNFEHKYEYLDIEDIIKQVITELSQIHAVDRYRINIDVKTPEKFISVHSMIQQLLYNIINNALCYSPEGSVISITAKTQEKGLKIIIMDEGIGIMKEAIDKVFEMFYKATTTSKGNGLGLYMSEKIIKMLNGKINIYSEEHKGTTVFIVVPKDSQPGIHGVRS